MPGAPRVLLLVPKTTYRLDDFVEAARRLGVEWSVGSDRCVQLSHHWGVPLALDFRHPERAARQIEEHAAKEPFDAVVGTDDRSAVVASLASRALGLPANDPDAAYAARNKSVMRERLHAAGVRAPAFRVLEADATPEDLERAARAVGWPVVVKPLLMSGSRGVQRADGPAALAAAVDRLRRILRAPDVEPSDDPASRQVLLESFVPGVEVAVEGILGKTGLRLLALFDKPDPLDGPIFEETIYVTPSRLDEAHAEEVRAVVERAARALGLERGPVHAEVRLSPEGPVPVEVAGRTIGGLCSRALRFGTGRTLEEIVLADALGIVLDPLPREAAASGVLMLPVPKRGILREVRGLEKARAVPLVESVEITAKLDHEIVPLPDAAMYVGFVFARGRTPAEVEAALRAAHARLSFGIAPNLAIPKGA